MWRIIINVFNSKSGTARNRLKESVGGLFLHLFHAEYCIYVTKHRTSDNTSQFNWYYEVCVCVCCLLD